MQIKQKNIRGRGKTSKFKNVENFTQDAYFLPLRFLSILALQAANLWTMSARKKPGQLVFAKKKS